MRIFIRAKPKANDARVLKLDETHYEVSVREPAEGGRANAAIERALARHFGVPVSRVQIISGHASRVKKADIVV